MAPGKAAAASIKASASASLNQRIDFGVPFGNFDDAGNPTTSGLGQPMA